MAFGDNIEYVRDKDGVVRPRKSRKPGSIYGSGSTGAFAHEDLPEEGPYESLAELALGDKVKEKMSTALGGSTSKTGLKPETGIWANLKKLFGGSSSSNDDETKEKVIDKWNKDINIPFLNEKTERKIFESIWESVESVLKGVLK